LSAIAQILSRTRTTPIGLDVGAGGYRAVQLRYARGQHTLEHCLCVDAPAAPGTEGAASAAFRRIRDDLRGAGFQRSAVVTSALACETEYHLLEIPAGVLTRPESEATEAVRWEVARGISGAIDDYEVRHWIAPGSASGGPSAIAVSVRRQPVIEMIDACRGAGLDCRGVEPFATALCQLGCLLRRPDPRTVWGLLDVGLGQCRLVLCVDDMPLLVRTVGAGGQAWTQQIAESLQISAKAAEVQKRDHGIDPPAHGAVTGADGSRGDEVGALLLGALRSELGQLAAEIKRSYEYVLTFHTQRQAVDLLLVGGGARLKNLPELLTAALGIPVRRASDCLSTPGCSLLCSSLRPGEFDSCALAIGLAAGRDGG